MTGGQEHHFHVLHPLCVQGVKAAFHSVSLVIHQTFREDDHHRHLRHHHFKEGGLVTQRR